MCYERERVTLRDGDFVDLDIALCGRANVDTCLVLLHGLEGSSQAPYVKSFARLGKGVGVDMVAMNLRGCSGELNRKARFYHSGETGDLRDVIAYLSSRYRRIGLIGFSLGGNVVLRYLGEEGDAAPAEIFGGVAFSAPVDLARSAGEIGRPENAFYMKRFIRLLAAKIEAKAKVFPEEIDPRGCRAMRSFLEFDGAYTAPLCGYASAEDYWARCSALPVLGDIRRPALLLSSRDDPFLSESCFPFEIAQASEWFALCAPEHGGHLGFPAVRKGGQAWHERVAFRFLGLEA